MTSTVFTAEMIREMAARGDRPVTIGELECPTLAAAVAELDALHGRRERIAVLAMRQYRAGERTGERKAMCFAPSRAAEAALTEATNVVRRAYGLTEWHPDTV